MKRSRSKRALALVLLSTITLSYSNSGRAAFASVSAAPGQNSSIVVASGPAQSAWATRHPFHHGHFRPFASSYAYSYYYPPYPYYYPDYYSYPPYGYSPPYYYPRYMRDYSYPGYTPYTVYDLGSPAFPSSRAKQRVATYYQAGHNWGQDLRQDIVSWEQFIDYVKKTLENASTAAQEDFRRGFASAYGSNAEAALGKALEQAGLSAAPEDQ